MGYTLKQLDETIKHVIQNNRFLEANGKKTIAVEIIGNSGIGKTSLVEQIASDLNTCYVKKNLAQLDELSELIGHPIREFKTVDGIWVNEKQLDQQQYSLTGETRTTHCPPSWIPKENKNGGILLLDDYSRAQQRFIQATMELINRGEYDEWKIPAGWTVILTSNPDNGQYTVSMMDDAQKTRYLSFDAIFNMQEWAEWAEFNNIDTRCINFMLLNPEVITDKINARIATEFFNSISSLNNFYDVKNLNIIEILGSGSVGPDFTRLFILFINNRLDRLPSPTFLFEEEDEEKVISTLKKTIGDKNQQNYKNSIAGVISQRIINYTKSNIKKRPFVHKNTIARMSNILTNDIFADDATLFIVKELCLIKQYENLFLNTQIRKLAYP